MYPNIQMGYMTVHFVEWSCISGVPWSTWLLIFGGGHVSQDPDGVHDCHFAGESYIQRSGRFLIPYLKHKKEAPCSLTIPARPETWTSRRLQQPQLYKRSLPL
jgi:hypothetical protein